MSIKREVIAPSIGSVDLNYDRKGNRVRQIVEVPIDDATSLLPILSQADTYAERHGATRKLIRAFTNSDLIRMYMRKGARDGLEEDNRKYKIEAVIPLSGDLKPYSIIYFGHNSPQRTSSNEVLEQEKGFINNIHTKERKSPDYYISRANTEYRLERLTEKLDDRDKERMVEMYMYSFKSYPFNIQEAIMDMVKSPTTHVYAARSLRDGQLYAICTTEQVGITMPDRTFIMREMGDSAKMPQVNGLNAPLKLMLLKEAADDNVDLVFCETRAALIAVNYINYSIGMSYCGMLQKHTAISGPQDVEETILDGRNGIYGNMNVWALNQEGIKRVVSQI